MSSRLHADKHIALAKIARKQKERARQARRRVPRTGEQRKQASGEIEKLAYRLAERRIHRIARG